MKTTFSSIVVCIAMFVNIGFSEKNSGRDLMSDTWVASDGLGRTLSNYETCGPVRKNKFVGIFYFIWLGVHGYDEARNPSDEGQGVLPKTKKRIQRTLRHNRNTEA